MKLNNNNKESSKCRLATLHQAVLRQQLAVLGAKALKAAANPAATEAELEQVLISLTVQRNEQIS